MAGLQKILLVEDNPQLQEIYSITLQSAGYEVTIAGNGPHALQQAIVFKPDLIFLDIMMPGMNGLEVLQALRDKPEYNAQKTKIVILTNLGHDDRVEDAWQKQADGYVVKAEIRPEELIDVIKSFEQAPVDPPPETTEVASNETIAPPSHPVSTTPPSFPNQVSSAPENPPASPPPVA
jgi:two-component system, OmpR family, alkaline phosphatase synthesis response regulator PhoP